MTSRSTYNFFLIFPWFSNRDIFSCLMLLVLFIYWEYWETHRCISILPLLSFPSSSESPSGVISSKFLGVRVVRQDYGMPPPYPVPTERHGNGWSIYELSRPRRGTRRRTPNGRFYDPREIARGRTESGKRREKVKSRRERDGVVRRKEKI